MRATNTNFAPGTPHAGAAADRPPDTTATTPRPRLAVDSVTLEYQTARDMVVAAQDVSFDVRVGDRTVLLGPSGCGKSSLLKAIAGFVSPAAGEIRIDGQRVRGPGPERMVVFQDFNQLAPWKTALGNVMFPLRATKTLGRAAARDRAREALDKVGLSRFRDAYPHTLSGGMKQRVAIARALSMRPRILLMDEPFASLDALTRRRMQDELLRLWETERFSMLFVTHSIEEAQVVGNRLVVLSAHPGRVRAELGCGGPASDGEAGSRQARRIRELLFESEGHAA